MPKLPPDYPDDNRSEYVVLGSIVGFIFAIMILAMLLH